MGMSLRAFVCLAMISAPAMAAQTQEVRIQVGKDSVRGTWYLPAGEAQAWVLLQHGFMRSPGHLKDLAGRFSENGFAVLTLALSQGQMYDTNFTRAMADVAVKNPPAPGGHALPEHFVIAGHSLGGLFAARLSAEVVRRAPSGFRGTLLLDPVERDENIKSALEYLSITDTPILAIIAEPGTCNMNNNAMASLQRIQREFIGIRMKGGTHCDAEGRSSDWTCNLACGKSRDENVAILQEISGAWLRFFMESAGDAYLPGGERFEELARAQKISPLLP